MGLNTCLGRNKESRVLGCVRISSSLVVGCSLDHRRELAGSAELSVLQNPLKPLAPGPPTTYISA